MPGDFGNDGLARMTVRGRSAILPAAAASLVLIACDPVTDMTRSQSRMVVQGPLTVLASGSALDAIEANPDVMPTVTYTAMIEYAPGRKAVIYRSARTEYVNVGDDRVPLAYFPRGTYRIEGREVPPADAGKSGTGPVLVSRPAGVDKWIEASRMELVEKAENSSRD
ncbi:hypothetical protein SAMN02745824_0413 [Parasphingorhabdus marina DSM 22363]|uniref:Uncharacterized protein n=1 Tax=Parasphingorhabdus marina DSM 22363 TaxID=1123272 RepID=A0A1N6CN59_9SPHN|nr:hypothetical protein [Parasphingorhabdus marina]SIN59875.1 hypothetical protein SAMN02745824_0413 [Parasphingorhabdus marina DSM 22363]